MEEIFKLAYFIFIGSVRLLTDINKQTNSTNWRRQKKNRFAFLKSQKENKEKQIQIYSGTTNKHFLMPSLFKCTKKVCVFCCQEECFWIAYLVYMCRNNPLNYSLLNTKCPESYTQKNTNEPSSAAETDQKVRHKRPCWIRCPPALHRRQL